LILVGWLVGWLVGREDLGVRNGQELLLTMALEDQQAASNQPTNQSTIHKQPFNPRTNQPNTQPTNQPTNQIPNQPNIQATNQQTNQPTKYPDHQPTNLRARGLLSGNPQLGQVA